jgi:hypothetical protein
MLSFIYFVLSKQFKNVYISLLSIDRLSVGLLFPKSFHMIVNFSFLPELVL